MSAVPSSATTRPLALVITPDQAWVKVALVVGGAVLTALTAQWEIPLWPVPISAQTLSVLVVGASLGATLGGLSMLTYLGMGAVGLPVFSGGAGGAAHLAGPTIGYLVGFVVAAALMGWMAERGGDRTARKAAVTFGIGTVVILALGVVGLMVTLGYDLPEAMSAGVYPFLPGAVLKGAMATVLIPMAWRWTERRGLSD